MNEWDLFINRIHVIKNKKYGKEYNDAIDYFRLNCLGTQDMRNDFISIIENSAQNYKEIPKTKKKWLEICLKESIQRIEKMEQGTPEYEWSIKMLEINKNEINSL